MGEHLPIVGTTLRQRTQPPVDDTRLQASLAYATDAFEQRKDAVYAQFRDVGAVRDAARAMKADVLGRLDEVLARLADQLEAAGAIVHWAATAEEARAAVAEVVAASGAGASAAGGADGSTPGESSPGRSGPGERGPGGGGPGASGPSPSHRAKIVKSKSMLSEEIGLNAALEDAGHQVTETDLGEWIIQLAHETPSHIIAPAIHKDRGQIRDTLRRVAAGDLSDVPEELAAFAREQLRQRFLDADVGISGVNLAVAETGSLVLVTNEGNGRLSTALPRRHVALLGIERVVERWDQADLLLALLPRAATGQPITTYVSTITGPRRPVEVDGPEEVHVVLVDAGRSDILGTEYTEMLACIRCGACLNVCPVYRQTGGHAYGWVYPGPMGAVLTPLLYAGDGASELPNASSLCGACWDACPVGIPLQDLLLSLRRDAAEDATAGERLAWGAWASAWSRPWTYRASLGLASMGARMLDPARIPGPPQRWALGREAPEPARRSFRRRWREELS